MKTFGNGIRLALVASAVFVQTSCQTKAETLRASTVKITVEHREGRSIGSGIILCQSGGRLDILTAKHVLTGRGLVDDSGERGQRFSKDRSYQVAFYRNLHESVTVADHAIQKADFKDVALITVRGVGGRPITATLGSSEGLDAPQVVRSVGHHLELSDGDWFHAGGEVQQAGEFIHHSSKISGGFSGGPLYDKTGRVVGMNLQAVAGVARAMPIEEAMSAVKSWLDPHCGGGVTATPPATRPSPSQVDPGPGKPTVGQREVRRVGLTPKSWRRSAGRDFAWRFIPAGSFRMGSPESEEGRDADEKPHYVTLTRGFWIGETEVTQAQWKAVMGTNPARFQACGTMCPVETVNWYEAIAFANELSRLSGLEACYEPIQGNGRRAGEGLEYKEMRFNGIECSGYRLPTEAEWEYAARAATTAVTYIGSRTILDGYHSPELGKVAWYGGNSGVSYPGGSDCSNWELWGRQHTADRCGTHPVGRKPRNAWGLADMLGNVWEWTQDVTELKHGKAGMDTYGSGVHNPLGHRGSERIIRGGSWRNFAEKCRTAKRGVVSPDVRDDIIGFRLVRAQP